MDRLEEKYFNYLKNLIRNPEKSNYETVLECLWSKEYYSVLPNDQNRAKDGIFLRDWIGADVDYAIFGRCRVLEMLIAVSKRLEFEITGTGYNKDFVDLFWELLDNLDLLYYDDVAASQDADILKIDYILTAWIKRDYAETGFGGIFPIQDWRRGVDKPQHRVEIWYQMMLYLEINYPF